MEKYEKWERLLKMAIILTVLMTLFSTGMNVAAIMQQGNIDGLYWWTPIQYAALVVGPIILVEILIYRHVRKKNREEAEKREKAEKEKARLERKAKAEARRAKQQKKRK